MSDNSRENKSLKSRLFSPWKRRDRSRSAQMEQPTSVTQPATMTPHSPWTSSYIPQSASPSNSSNTRGSTPDSKLQDPHYAAIGGLPVTALAVSRTEAVGSTLYEGLKTVLEALYQCSDMFLPLKTASGVFLSIVKTIETVAENKKELEDLKAKLGAIIAIVKTYQEHNGLRALDNRIESFCLALTLQLNEVGHLQNNSLFTRTAEGTKDADAIIKAIRNITSLCDIFQIDTQLNIEERVGDILQRLKFGSIDKLNHEMISYKTRNSSYGDPTGCMPGTRVKILADLVTWAWDPDSRKVYWMIGMAGTGKSAISHTFCEILDEKNILGGNFFASRASDKANNPRLIIPVIAYALAKASPSIRLEVIKAIEDDPALAESTYLNVNEQFKKLIYNPIRKTAGNVSRTYKIVVIDALDECVNPAVISSLIKVILQLASDIPLKFFIASRDEFAIRNAFRSGTDIRECFYLHDIEKDVVQEDIRMYLEISMAKIRQDNSYETAEGWPSQAEVSGILNRSGILFVYAATAVRYIADGAELYKSRLSEMAEGGLESVSEFQTDIDVLYVHILGKACERKRDSEMTAMRNLVSMIVFLRNPLPVQAITFLSETDTHSYLSPLASVIHIPSDIHAAVAPFHASFPDFIMDRTRCSSIHCPSFPALIPSEGHGMLALKCLKLMNNSLKYNICDVPPESTVSRREATNLPDSTNKIPEALKYSCLYWVSHLEELPAPAVELVDALHQFIHEHLLHWIECLSIVRELQTGIRSLQIVKSILARFQITDPRRKNLELLVDDARRCLQLNFECIQKHCFEIYQSALVWIPKKSPIRDVYATNVNRVPKVVLGLSDYWGPTEIVMQNNSVVNSVAFSHDGSRVVSGSHDKTVRIWNTTTGEIQAELKGHSDWVNSVAFSQDGSLVASGSNDKKVLIWNTMTGEIQAELKGHTGWVTSVAFSLDGSRVVSGSVDKTIRTWNTVTGETQAGMVGHTHWVNSVAFSHDGGRVVSGSHDYTVRIWNTATGEIQAELKGHTDRVRSVVFSNDGSRVISGSNDRTVRVWNTTTGEIQAELKGHTGWVTSVAFSLDGSRAVSGSNDKTVRIWNTATGEIQAELKGHTHWVESVAFSQDGSQVVSGSDDYTVRIWNTATSEIQAELKGHTFWVRSVDGSRGISGSHDKTIRTLQAVLKGHTEDVNCVAFSQDGSRVISGSHDGTVRIWNTATGEIQAELNGHTDCVSSVAFSPDGSRAVSGSEDKTVRIWNTTTGDIQKLKGHTDSVNSVAFSQDGSRVISGSSDETVRIWNTTTGEIQSKLNGHTGSVVNSVAFSQDGSQVVSGSVDKTIRIWNTTTGEIQGELKGHTNWVTSVAFSQDGSQVISGSMDNTVRIWNARTGEMQVMTSLLIKLPDASAVHRKGDREFHIVYPSQYISGIYPSLSLTDGNQWIIGLLRDCWIPSQDSNFTCSSFSGQRVSFGYSSGRVMILDMTNDCCTLAKVNPAS